MTFRGLAHVHSTFSYDGRHTLEELVGFAEQRGLQFLAMSEHSDTLTEAAMGRYVEACEQVSRVQCVVIPGIEFTCNGGLHILGYGVRRFTMERDPVRVVEFIRAQDGVSVIAHPARYGYELPMSLASRLHGLEVWNAGYDGRFLPNTRTLAILNAWRDAVPGLHAYGGQDLHVIKAQCLVETELPLAYLNSRAILIELAKGAFRVRNRYLGLHGDDRAEGVRGLGLGLVRHAYEWVRERRRAAR